MQFLLSKYFLILSFQSHQAVSIQPWERYKRLRTFYHSSLLSLSHKHICVAYDQRDCSADLLKVPAFKTLHNSELMQVAMVLPKIRCLELD